MFKVWRNYWGLGLTVGLAAIFAGLYFFGSFIDNYDAAGHRIMIDGMREFWPWPIGWDNNTFLGHMDGAAYPMLAHWLITGLSFLIGTGLAMKLVVALSILALPFTIYWYTKKWPNKWLLLFAILGVMMILPGYIGGNFSGLFSYGLLPAWTVMPLFFAFLACLDRTKDSRKFVVWTAILLSAIIWTHLVAAIAAGTFLIAKLFDRHDRAEFKSLLIVIAIGTIVGAPLLLSTVLSATNVIQTAGGLSTLFAVNVCLLLVASFMTIKSKLWSKSVELRAAVILLAFLVAVPALVKISSFSLIHHGYRLQLFAYIFIAIAVIQAVKIKKRHLKILTLTVTVCLVLLGGYRLMDTIKTVATVEINQAVSGRFIESFRRTETLPTPYAVQQRLVASGGEWANGLFSETAPNAPFVQSLIKSLRPEAYKNLGNSLDEVIKNPDDTTKLLRTFGVSNIISLDDKPAGSIGTLKTDEKTFYYHNQNIDGISLAEAIDPNDLEPVNGDWNTAIEQWWRKPLNNYLYDAHEGKITATKPAQSVKILEYSRARIRIKIDSDQTAPILIKETWNKKWRAADINGNEIKIRKFAPYLILIEAKGEITLTI